MTPKQRPISSYHPQFSTTSSYSEGGGRNSVNRQRKRTKRSSSYEEVNFLPRRLTTHPATPPTPSQGPRQRPLLENGGEQSSLESGSVTSSPPHSADEGFPDIGYSATDSDVDSLNSEDQQHEYAILEPENFIHEEELVAVEEVDNEFESEPSIEQTVDNVSDMPCSASSTCNGVVVATSSSSTTSNINNHQSVQSVVNNALDLEDEDFPVADTAAIGAGNVPHRIQQPSTSVVDKESNVALTAALTSEEDEEEDEEGYVEVEHEFTTTTTTTTTTMMMMNVMIEDCHKRLRPLPQKLKTA